MELYNQNTYSRPVSLNEKLYIIGEPKNSPFCIQIIIEGIGNISIGQLENAVKKSSMANPGSRLILSREDNKLKWIDSGIAPNVRIVSLEDFEKHSLKENPFLLKGLAPFNKATSEVIFIKGSSSKIIFKSFHGTMDAKGVLHWAKDIFKCLKNEIPIGTNSNLTDFEYVTKLAPKQYRTPIKFSKASPFNKFSSNKFDTSFHRLTIPGRQEALVAKLSKLISSECYKVSQDSPTFMVPVDLRRHDKTIQTTANFSYPLFINIKKNLSWQEIHQNILQQLIENKELSIDSKDSSMEKLPFSLLKTGVNFFTKFIGIRKKHLVSAIISNLGKIDLNEYSTNSFKAMSIYSLPVPVPMIPITMVIVENPEHIEILFSFPKNFKEKVKLLSKNIQSEFVYKKEAKPNLDIKKVLDLNKTKASYPNDLSTYQAFLKCVEKDPNAIALYQGKKKISYNELNNIITTIANGLLTKGIIQGDVVAVLGNRRIETIASIISIIKIGGIYLPIDPANPLERIEFILKDSNAKFCLVRNKNQITRKIDLSIKKLMEFQVEDINKIKVKSKDLCYIIYTSGSTGTPKGVEIKHLSLINYVWWSRKTYRLENKPHFALFTSLAFDLTISTLFIPLLSGGAIHLYPNELDHISIQSIINNSSINALKLTPTHLELFTRLGHIGTNKKTFIIGGEQLKIALVQKAHKLFPSGSIFFNEYGPTEATVGCIVHEFDPNKDYMTAALPIGTPCSNTEIFLFDSKQNEVKPGELGEIYIAGDCLARGYKGQINLTKKSFIKYKNGKTLYKTGDIAFLRNDYLLEFKERCDDQVKIRGHRIELSEIEIVLDQHKYIKQALVLSRKTTLGKNLCAYLIVNKDFDQSKLNLEVNKKLPNYMIPNHYFIIERFPITINGKININSLPTPNTISDNEELITDKLELSLLKIWSKLLKIPQEKVGLHQSFFTLGGNSVLLIEMLGIVDTQFQNNKKIIQRLPDFLKEPTLKTMAKQINSEGLQ